MLTTSPEQHIGVRPLRLLVVASELPASAVCASLQQELGAGVTIVPGLLHGHAVLRQDFFDVILVEDALSLDHPQAIDLVYDCAGSAIVLEVNFGTTNASRLARQVRHAVLRGGAAEDRLRQAAVDALHSDLRGSLAGLLLQSQLALRSAGPEFQHTLAALVQIAETLCEHLQHGADKTAPFRNLHLSE